MATVLFGGGVAQQGSYDVRLHIAGSDLPELKGLSYR